MRMLRFGGSVFDQAVTVLTAMSSSSLPHDLLLSLISGAQLTHLISSQLRSTVPILTPILSNLIYGSTSISQLVLQASVGTAKAMR
jgi:hypothetical protein